MWNFFKKKGSSAEKLTERQLIAKAMNCDINRLSSIDDLAISTVLIPSKITQNNSYLCKSTVTKCDTIFFSAFVIRAILIGAASSRMKAIQFSDEYITKTLLGTKYLYSSSDKDFDKNEMFDNRMSFYDSVFMSRNGINEKLNAITEEFEYVIKTDIIQKAYTPFDQNSPLPILGFYDDMMCAKEARAFLGELQNLVFPYYNRVLSNLQQ